MISLCHLERIGGISGQRVTIHRIVGIKNRAQDFRKEYLYDYVQNGKEIIYRIIMAKNKDTLKLDKEVDLDKFFFLLNNYPEQPKVIIKPLDSTENKVGIIEYEYGKVTKVGMIHIDEILEFLEKHIVPKKYKDLNFSRKYGEGKYGIFLDFLQSKEITFDNSNLNYCYLKKKRDKK